MNYPLKLKTINPKKEVKLLIKIEKKKYKKAINNIIIDKLHNYENISEDNKLYKYSLSKIYLPNNTIYYICADTHCGARIKIQYDFDLDNRKYTEYKIKNIELTKELDLEYESHNYYNNEKYKEDYKYLSLLNIKKNVELLFPDKYDQI